jgi:hypothetical protein
MKETEIEQMDVVYESLLYYKDITGSQVLVAHACNPTQEAEIRKIVV